MLPGYWMHHLCWETPENFSIPSSPMVSPQEGAPGAYWTLVPAAVPITHGVKALNKRKALTIRKTLTIRLDQYNY